MKKTFLSFIVLMAFAKSFASEFLLDGYFSDWNDCKSTYLDTQKDASDVDFLSMSFRHDADWLYIKLEVAEPLVLNENNHIYLEIDTDNNPSTGYRVSGIGAEMGWNFGARYGFYNLTQKARTLNHKNIELYALPTYQSKVFEIAIGRKVLPDGVTPLFNNDTIKVLFWNRCDEGDLMPNDGKVFTYVFTHDTLSHPTLQSLDKAAGTDFRAMTFNVFINGMTDPDRQPAFARIFQALQPDVVTLNECWKVEPGAAAALFNLWMPLEHNTSWSVVKTDDGNITCSRFPILKTINIMPGHSLSAVLLQLDASPDSQLMVINSHLTCCQADDIRQQEADAVIAFLRESYTGKSGFKVNPQTPFYISGDLNLVGDDEQLLTLMNGTIQDHKQFGSDYPPDNGNAGLTDLVSKVIGRRMAYTWRDSDKTFSPSRLDYMLYPASKILPLNAFTLQTEILEKSWLSQFRLYPNDTRIASDHLPRVADFQFRKQPE